MIPVTMMLRAHVYNVYHVRYRYLSEAQQAQQHIQIRLIQRSFKKGLYTKLWAGCRGKAISWG